MPLKMPDAARNGTSHAVASTPVSDIGKRFPAEKIVFVDAQTGATVSALTTSADNNAMIYPTHPQWAADGKHIVFRSNRAGGVWQAFAVHETTGEIIQLTDGAGTGGSLNVARRSNKLYFFRRTEESNTLVESDLERIFADSAADTLQGAEAYEREIATLPPNLRESGGFALDSDEKFAYVGVSRLDDAPPLSDDEKKEYRKTHPESPIAPHPGGIRSIDLESGAMETVVDVPFTMGHVQTNPWVAGEIIYCDETGGYADQRIWCVRSDGTGNRSMYPQAGGEWVTHEVVVDADHIAFSIMAHLPRLRKRPTGIALLNLRTEEMRIVGQVDGRGTFQFAGAPTEGRGFWHCNGSPDGRWIVGDDFAGNIHLIDRASGETTLLSSGHQMRPDHAHPAFSPDSRRILIQSGLLSEGKSLDLMVIPVPAWMRNRC